MSAWVFGPAYAEQYDLLYGDKDYEAECDQLEMLFASYGEGNVRSILDLGCGTGGHALPLARRGYEVVGVDRAPVMLARAQAKVATAGLPPGSSAPGFLPGDVRSVRLERTFDAVLMMFAVLGYQLTNEDVLAALRTVRHHLRPGGLFVCDVWYGPAVLAIRPGDRVKVVPTSNGKIIRAASPTLDSYRQVCTVHYRLWRLEGDRVLRESEEKHEMRYFFAQELDFCLRQEHLSQVDLRAFDQARRVPDEFTWNVLVVARRADERE